MENEGSDHNTSEMSKDSVIVDSDGSDGCDGSRYSASGISDNNPIVMTAPNQEGISSDTAEQVQGTFPGAITAVTAVTSVEPGNSILDTQVSNLPITTPLQQSNSETKQNAGDIYWSGANWYCRHCKLSGDKFDMEDHICKGHTPT